MNQQTFHGLLVIDKPKGVTSRDVVNRVQRWFPRKTRIGHCGTLDPLATGVLVLCVGAATRLTEYVQRMDKVYQTRIRLGATSDTDDADGVVSEKIGVQPCSREELDDVVKTFVGEIKQTPPKYSANKIGGRRACDLAREGKDVSLAVKTVRVAGIEILDFRFPHVNLEIRCGKGTYIRSIARDLGEILGCGGLVETLRRTCVGAFVAVDAVSLDADAELARRKLLPLGTAVLGLPSVTLSDHAIAKWRQGRSVEFVADSGIDEPIECAVYDQRTELVGIGFADPASRVVRPVKVLHS